MVYGKLVDKTLADMDYSELAELVYGQTYASDVARRMLYGSRKTLELLENEQLQSMNGEGAVSDINSRIEELQKERQKFYDQRREYKKLVNESGRYDHLCETLAAAANDVARTIGPMFDPCEIKRSSFGTDLGNDAVLVLGDWHYGLVASNAFNEFNTEICKERVKAVVDNAIIRIILHQCDVLHIVVLGDLFHGAIHTSARVAAEELVCDQLMQVSEILAQAIFNLSQYVSETKVYMTYGNHARTVQNKNDSIHRDNLERIIPWWLEQRICAEEHMFGENLHITIMPDTGNEFVFVDAVGHCICASHGDLDSVQSSPRLLTTLFQKKYGRDVEYIVLGDKHHRESFDELGVTASICGSLCGTDDFANSKRLFSTPSQLLLIVNKNSGVDAEYRLRCE